MRITTEKTNQINREYTKLQHESEKRAFCFGLKAHENVMLNACITSETNGMYICKVEEINDLIKELTMMKQAIENTTGIILGE